MKRITLKAARVNANMTQLEVCKALQISRQTMVAWEKGRIPIKAVYLDAMCRLYGVTRDEIFLPERST